MISDNQFDENWGWFVDTEYMSDDDNSLKYKLNDINEEYEYYTNLTNHKKKSPHIKFAWLIYLLSYFLYFVRFGTTKF